MILLWGWLACSGGTELDSGNDTQPLTHAAPTSGTTSTSSPSTPPSSSSSPGTSNFWGTVIDPPLPPPTFSVLNQDGEARTEIWLEQGPTVLWFYRDAGTAG